MKFLISLLLCSIAAAQPDDKCEEGTTWMMECNSCTCMNGAPACTEMACPPRGNHAHKRNANVIRAKRSEELVVKPNSYKDHCKPGDIWKDQDCNRCSCDDILSIAKAVCTRRKCPGGETLTPTPGWENIFNIEGLNERKKRSKDYGVVKDDSYLFNCRQGDSWTNRNCNTCICDEYGVVCTDNACPGGKTLTPTPGWENIFNIIKDVAQRRDKRSDELVIKEDSYAANCRLGDTWEDQDCNECYCDKVGAVCTRRLCIDGQKQAPTPGWENMFNIDEDFLKSIQQRTKRSEESVIKHNSYKQNCQIGDRWRDQDCNRCWCGDDNKAVCTKRMCSDNQKLEPTPGWENMFNIDEDILKSIQQRTKRSEESVIKHNSYKQNCQIGDRWRDQDCNRCWCDDDKKAVCTRRKCSDNQKLEPTPGWENMFNIMQEDQDRRKRSQQFIISESEWRGERYPRRSQPGPSCRPGESYFDGCNFCQCQSSGIPSCTYKGCASYDKNGFPTGVGVAVDPPTGGRPPYIAVDPPKYPTTSGGRPPYIAVDPPKYPTTSGGRPPYIAVDPPKYPTRPPYIAVDPTYNPNNNRGGYQG